MNISARVQGLGGWKRRVLPIREAGKFLTAKAKEYAPHLVRLNLTNPMNLLLYRFIRDVAEDWYNPIHVLSYPNGQQVAGKGELDHYDCEDYAEAMASLAMARGYPDARVHVISARDAIRGLDNPTWEPPPWSGGPAHATARVNRRLVDVSGVLETGQGREHLRYAQALGLVSNV